MEIERERGSERVRDDCAIGREEERMREGKGEENNMRREVRSNLKQETHTKDVAYLLFSFSQNKEGTT